MILGAVGRTVDGIKVREYFESGCICILSGNIPKLSSDFDNWEAVEFYEKNCNCSRNYKHLEEVIVQRV